ncbi:MAG: thiamine-phosphate kinase [Magnetospiraceae bacterium]
MIGEFDLISKYFKPLAGNAEALGLTDDAALLDVPTGKQLVVTTDMLVADVHFLADDPPETIAAKLLGVNLSDLAAMGAAPHGHTVALALPKTIDEDWVASFAAGLGEAQSSFGSDLLGGDTVATSGPLTLSLTALGVVAPEKALRRDQAQVGDHVFVSGPLGDAAAGLDVLQHGTAGLSEAHAAYLADRYRRPTPRLALGQALGGSARCAADISDGLVADLAHICRASGVSAQLRLQDIPLSGAFRAWRATGKGTETLPLTGGDDYELVVCGPADLSDRVSRDLIDVGHIVARDAEPVQVFDQQGRLVPVSNAGFRHF